MADSVALRGGVKDDTPGVKGSNMGKKCIIVSCSKLEVRGKGRE